MKFRKLYWVTEQVGSDGSSEIAGVYTSIPDLIDRGIQWKEGMAPKDGFRLTLVALDSTKKPLGVWMLPEVEAIQSALDEYVKTQEFTSTEVESLIESLRGFHATV